MSDTDEQAPTAASTTSPSAEPAADNGKKAEEEGQGETRSHSGSEQPATKRSGSHSRSHSRSRSHRRYGRSHSRSRRRRSRSRSGSLEYRHRHRSTSHSPLSNRRRHIGNRQCHCEMPPQANPNPSGCLGVFGLSLYTSERDLRDVFSRYGPISEVKVVFDQQTGRSRGFAFVYFETDTDAKEAKDRANGMELDGRNIRVDFSITKRPHTPTPGVYMGRPTYPTGYREAYRDPNVYDRGYEKSYDRGYERNYDRGCERDYDRNYNRYDDYNYRMERYRRTPSPYYRGRYRSRSRSYSPRRY